MPTHQLLATRRLFGARWRFQSLATVGVMIFFFAFADSLLSFILPLLIVERGFTPAQMGLIIASSSAAGALFDLFASRFIRNASYRRIYFSVLILAGIFGAWLLQSRTVGMFVIAMVFWGIYWDLFHFANYDFVSRTAREKEHSGAFGVLAAFKALGAMLAPLVAGLVIGIVVGLKPFLIAFVSLTIALFVWSLLLMQRSRAIEMPRLHPPLPAKQKLKIWLSLFRQIWPVLFLVWLIYLLDAFFWTAGPLMAEDGSFGVWGGLLLTIYTLPTLLMGWAVGGLTKRHGKKRTAFFSLMAGALILTLLWLGLSGGWLLLIVLLASIFLSLVLPSIEGAFADYVAETREIENEIEGVVDLFYNMGWIVGPALAGVFVQEFGAQHSFAAMGVVVALAAFLLWTKTPAHITIHRPK